MAYTEVTLGKNARKVGAGPTKSLKAKPFDKTKKQGSTNKLAEGGKKK